jgi:hypothetical protein
MAAGSAAFMAKPCPQVDGCSVLLIVRRLLQRRELSSDASNIVKREAEVRCAVTLLAREWGVREVSVFVEQRLATDTFPCSAQQIGLLHDGAPMAESHERSSLGGGREGSIA